jgi:hypothetical protein
LASSLRASIDETEETLEIDELEALRLWSVVKELRGRDLLDRRDDELADLGSRCFIMLRARLSLIAPFGDL